MSPRYHNQGRITTVYRESPKALRLEKHCQNFSELRVHVVTYQNYTCLQSPKNPSPQKYTGFSHIKQLIDSFIQPGQKKILSQDSNSAVLSKLCSCRLMFSSVWFTHTSNYMYDMYGLQLDEHSSRYQLLVAWFSNLMCSGCDLSITVMNQIKKETSRTRRKVEMNVTATSSIAKPI